MNEALAMSQLSQFPPWHLQGEAFILNYWISPQFIRQHKTFRIAPSPIGRVVQVMLVRYHQSPVGPYDELLLLDQPLLSKRRLSSIPKIYVSTQISVEHGQQLWGIPKEFAQFDWHMQNETTQCQLSTQNQTLRLTLTQCKKARPFYINSHHIPRSMLKIQQAWQGQRYEFSPQFRAKLMKLKNLNGKTIPPFFQTLAKPKLYKVFMSRAFSSFFQKPKSALNKKAMFHVKHSFENSCFVILHSYPKIF